MTEKTITDSSAIEPKSSAQDLDASSIDNQPQDTVAYETYRKTLTEAKKAKAERAELMAKIEQYENAKLESEGRKDEVIEKIRKEKEDLFNELKTTKASYAETQIRNQIGLKAKDLGCVDVDALVKLMDFDGLDIVDGYKVSDQSLDMVLTKAKQEKAYLFGKPAPKIQDGVPVNQVDNAVKKAVSADLSKEDLIKMARDIDQSEGKTLGWS